MVAGKSPDWLPPGFTEKVKYKNGRKIKYYYHVATSTKYYSKKDVMGSVTAGNGLLRAPETANGDNNGLSSNKKVDAILVKTNDSPQWLPEGWTMEEKTRQSGSRKGSAYKIYTHLSSGSKFYSRAAVTRYLDTVDHANTMAVQKKIDNRDKPFPEISPQSISMTSASHDSEKKRKSSTFKIDNVDKPFPKISTQCISLTSASHDSEKKRKSSAFKTIAIETTAADDLPPGWIKEIKTSKSGNRIRKDPYYTDPVSGYIFRSKLDALRYLKTNDIGSCACKPHTRESDNLKLIKNEILSSNPGNEKSEQKRQIFPREESNVNLSAAGGETSGAKSLSESEANGLKQTQDDNVSDSINITSVGANFLNEKTSCENSGENDETENGPEPVKKVSKENPRVMAADAAICSPVTDSLATRHQHSESGMEKQTGRTRVNSKKSNKRRNVSLPSRSSKRISGREPEMLSNLNLSERSLRAAARRSSGIEVDTSSASSLKVSAGIPLTPHIEPAKEAAEDEFIGDKTPQKIEPLHKVQKPHAEKPAIPDDQTDWKASERQLDDGKRPKESQLCYDFGDSWSDPLEFALKTLRGEIPIEDTLAFSGSLDEQLNIPYTQTDGCMKSSKSDEPVIFQNEFVSNSESSKLNIPYNQAGGCLKLLGGGLKSSSKSDEPVIFQDEFVPHSESSKKHGSDDRFQSNPPLFSAPGNISFSTCGSYSIQSVTEARKRDFQKKYNP